MTMYNCTKLRGLLLVSLYILTGCTSSVARKSPLGEVFPSIKGEALAGKNWKIPEDLMGEKSLLLIGYKQKSQFDIDRWLIGIDTKAYKVNVFELPVVSGLIPYLISKKIDDGMRSGIPEELWTAVVTVYEEADKIIQFIGNEDGLNARVFLLDEEGRVVFLHDRGFSVPALNRLGEAIKAKTD